MNKKEIRAARELLRGRVDRFETTIVGNGQYLTVYWIDGGRHLFTSLRDVQDWLADKSR